MKLKKFTAGIIGTFIAFAMSAGYCVNASDMGDITDSGSIDAGDALEILNHTVGNKTLSEEQQKLADIDGNGTIDSADALCILQCVVGLKSSVYEKFTGEYTGYFGDEKAVGYTDKNLTIKSFSISINSIQENNVNGTIYMDTNMMSDVQRDFTSEIKDGVMNVPKSSSDNLVQIDMCFYFNGNEITGTINKAVVMGESYSFPTVYFEKN